MNLFISLTNNIFEKVGYLKQDYIGISFDQDIFFSFLLNIAFCIFLIFLSFSFGHRIVSIFTNKKSSKKYEYLIYIAVGYIMISAGIGILGMISLFSPFYLTLYIVLIALYSFFPLSMLKYNILTLILGIKDSLLILKSNKLVLTWIILFVFMSLVNLLNPEIREDQYHVDFPTMYLQNNTTMIPPKEDLGVSASPMLADMSYTVGIAIVSKESARFIHFFFYLLTILTLVNFSKIKLYKFAIYTPLLFASAPVVIKEASSMYTDFQWIFFLLLSVFVLLNYKKNVKNIFLSGFLAGGVVAIKLWTIVLTPVLALFVFITSGKKQKNKYIFIFLLAYLFVILMWHVRSFLLTGNPIYPAFSTNNLNGVNFSFSLFDYIKINYGLINPQFYYNVFSPLFFVGIILTVFFFRKKLISLLNLDIFKLLTLVFILYISIQYPFGRYLLGLYIFFIFFAALGINQLIKKFQYATILINLVLLVIFSYYFISSILVLPYAFGISDKNKYLSRILIRDNSSYYDFGRNFDKYISNQDKVAMYNFHGYYYANFKYIDVNFIFDKTPNFIDLKTNGATKIMIRGGDIKWFCNQLKISNCRNSQYSFISSYLEYPTYYLYKIK